MDKYTQTRLALLLLVAVCAIWWLLFWFLQAFASSRRWLKSINDDVSAGWLGTSGSIFMLQGVPVAIIAIVAYVIVALREKKASTKELLDRDRKPKYQIWTLPIFLNSPLGMLTLGDLLFILVVVFVTFFYFIKRSIDASAVIDRDPIPAGLPSRYVSKFKAWGQYAGDAAMIPFALLWIPVSRGSPLLRVIGVPFEHAVKHHVWLGSLNIWLSSVHTAFTFVYLIHTRDISHILSWRNGTYVACIPAMIALGAGILMLFTALSPIRRRYYDLFFRVHHLYIVYLIFFGFHAFFEMYILIVPVLLFFLDRFMRMVQSRHAVDIVSAKVLPSGAMELRFAKPESLSYHALSFVYVLLPSVSRVQWHPFSVASSPLDGTNELSIYIKPLGKFTKSLHDALISSNECMSNKRGRPLFNCPFSFKVGLEGPYGDESSFYLRYQSLIMVAGGIGVTPFLAILRDILHRYQRLPNAGALPSSIHLIFVCRQAYELDILDTLAPNTILPGYEEHLKIRIQAFVTSKVPEESVHKSIDERARSTHIQTPMGRFIYSNRRSRQAVVPSDEDTPSRPNLPIGHSHSVHSTEEIRKVSPYSSTGHTGWVGLTVLATLVGFFVTWGIFNVTVLNPNYHNWEVILFYILCVILGVVLFGGGVMLSWRRYEQIQSRNLDYKVTPSGGLVRETDQVQATQGSTEAESTATRSATPAMPAMPVTNAITVVEGARGDIESVRAASIRDSSIWRGDLVAGMRPNWKEIFDKAAIDYEGQDVGVVVSGSPFMQVDVARECKRHSLSMKSNIVMHYHSVSFEF